MFDFDGFVNKPSIQIFGRSATITPANDQFAPFEIDGKDYQIIDIQTHIPGSKKLVLHESQEANN